MRVIRVAIADDDASIRTALSEVLEADSRFTVVGAAATGAELLDLVRTTEPHVVLLDVRMPGGGPAAAAALTGQQGGGSAGRSPAPVVIAVSAQTGAGAVAAMLRAGAVGYLVKGSLGTLPELVARCAAGEVVLAVPSAADALRQVMRKSQSPV
jgi:DNA-binding NarL/FixJ family response regulator